MACRILNCYYLRAVHRCAAVAAEYEKENPCNSQEQGSNLFEGDQCLQLSGRKR